MKKKKKDQRHCLQTVWVSFIKFSERGARTSEEPMLLEKDIQFFPHVFKSQLYILFVFASE